MEAVLFIWFVVAVVCAFLGATLVPSDQAAVAGLLGFFLGPFGVLAALLVSIRKAIEGTIRDKPQPFFDQSLADTEKTRHQEKGRSPPPYKSGPQHPPAPPPPSQSPFGWPE